MWWSVKWLYMWQYDLKISTTKSTKSTNKTKIKFSTIFIFIKSLTAFLSTGKASL